MPRRCRRAPATKAVKLSDDLRKYVRDRRVAVDDRLRRFLDDLSGCPPRLLEAMRYSLLGGGKRLRPLLVLLAHDAAGGSEQDALPAACAVEMVHTYSLIHDDLPAMDDDDLRRGQPACHKKFGEAIAILAGDALLTLAFEVVAAEYPAATAAACCRELARGAGAAGMVAGQIEDLAWEGVDRGGGGPPPAVYAGDPPLAPLAEALEQVHGQKTGALFRACLRLGAYTAQGEKVGGPEPDLLRRLDAYGRCFGLVFQITDDLLDVEGNAAETGKRVNKDAARGKLTYPGLLGVEESRRRARSFAEEAEEHLRPLGPGGDRLVGLLRMVLERDR